ncbi:MAG: single-stranded-DNA-specific exonuclease RecJ, partial [Tepidisphaeraceae bacterium]
RMQPSRRWIITEPTEAAATLAQALRTSPVIAQILINRGIKEPQPAFEFLNPNMKLLHDPRLMPNLETAARRIERAIREQQRIVIYGDYDVDGITATTILWHAIRKLGGQADFYIPHRIDEGYGLNSEAITQICDSGAQLIITVDCGVTAIEQAEICRKCGVDLIISDHHEWRESHETHTPMLPECFAIVHPRLPMADGPPTYPNPNICGAGVAFKLAWGVGQVHNNADRVSQEFREFLVEAMSLAALGTIADVVPLTGENRLLAHFGLLGLKRSSLVGIRALIESAGLTGQKLDAYHVGFLLAPRLNACGRMGHAREAVEMLTVADLPRAGVIASELESQNRARQALERQIFQEAMEQATRNGYDRDDCRGVVLAAEGWHAGVIGIVASRVVGKLNRPAIMIALADGHGHGSARSISGFHLAKALEACREHLETCGGHEMAAGLRLETAKLDAFRQAFMDHAAGCITPEMLVPELRLDCTATLGQVTEAMVNDLKRLGPFGTSNRRPLLCCRDVELTSAPRRVGKTGDHVQLLVRQNGTTMKCIAFNRPDLADSLKAGSRIDVAAEPGINEYNGYRNVELQVADVRLSE